jgi:ABC-type iron transport system FetAB ATPase subunit
MAPPDDCLLEVDALRSAFGGPFDLRLARGECICIQGPSGAGKSVLLRLIADLDPSSGTVRLDGALREDRPAPQWRRQVVYQAAEPAWWAPTAAGHFADPASEELLALMARLGLAPKLLATEIARLSTGERQRLALVRSLVAKPAVLLLDEPSASLDPASTAAMERLLKAQLDGGVGILMVTHSLEQADRMARRRFEMANGRLHALPP